MLIVRLIAVLAVLLAAGGVLAYFLTGKRQYLRFARHVFVAVIGLVLVIVALLALERLAIIPLPL